jgi:hypothetical protein
MNEIEVGVAEQMFANLAGIGGKGKGLARYFSVENSISFEIVGLPGEIRFFVNCPRKLADLVEKQILGSIRMQMLLLSLITIYLQRMPELISQYLLWTKRRISPLVHMRILKVIRQPIY